MRHPDRPDQRDPVTAGSAAPGRRVFLRGAGAVLAAGAAVTVVAACGSGGDAGGRPGLDSLPAESQAAITEAVQAGTIPVGGAEFLGALGLIVTRPAEGEYRVLRDVCTHQGAKVDRLDDEGRLVCPLHGSRFDAATGQAVVGPATQPLPARPVAMRGGTPTLR